MRVERVSSECEEAHLSDGIGNSFVVSHSNVGYSAMDRKW